MLFVTNINRYDSAKHPWPRLSESGADGVDLVSHFFLSTSVMGEPEIITISDSEDEGIADDYENIWSVETVPAMIPKEEEDEYYDDDQTTVQSVGETQTTIIERTLTEKIQSQNGNGGGTAAHSPLPAPSSPPSAKTPAEGDEAPVVRHHGANVGASMSPHLAYGEPVVFDQGKVFVKEVPGDGDCLFRACLHQLRPRCRQSDLPSSEEVAELRREVAGHMRENPHEYLSFFAEGCKPSFDESIQSVERLGSWGNSMSLRAICSLWDVRIDVYFELGSVIPHFPAGCSEVDPEAAVGRTLRLAYRCFEEDDGSLTYNHYDSVVRVELDPPRRAVPEAPEATSTPRSPRSRGGPARKRARREQQLEQRLEQRALPSPILAAGVRERLGGASSPTLALDAPGSPDSCGLPSHHASQGSQELQQDDMEALMATMFSPRTSPFSAATSCASKSPSERGRVHLAGLLSPSPSDSPSSAGALTARSSRSGEPLPADRLEVPDLPVLSGSQRASQWLSRNKETSIAMEPEEPVSAVSQELPTVRNASTTVQTICDVTKLAWTLEEEFYQPKKDPATATRTVITQVTLSYGKLIGTFQSVSNSH